MTGPVAARLPDGRLHFQHGPIDLILEAFGPEPECRAAYAQAWATFRPVLDDLAELLAALRVPVAEKACPAPAASSAHGRQRRAPSPQGEGVRTCRDEREGSAMPPAIPPGAVAAAMIRAVAPHASIFVTPMAAVAGAVADHVLAAMTAGRRLDRAYVNNGGDAALWLGPGTRITAAGGPGLSARIAVRHASPVRGIATSGWRGRSHSVPVR